MLAIQKKHSGLALIQVLLLVAMLSILLLLMVSNTQQQQKQVIALQTQLDQHFRTYSEMNDVLFSLLTHTWSGRGEAQFSGNISLLNQAATSPSQNGFETSDWNAEWNFYAYPFSVGNYSARITNLNSLVSIQGSQNTMALLLQHLGYSERDANSLASAVRSSFATGNAFGAPQLPSEQAQRDDLVPVQHLHELSLLPGWNKELMQRVAPYVTTFSSRLLNEAYMPDTMLEMMITEAQADIIRSMRAEGTFNRISFETVTELLEDEFRTFHAGPDFRIEVWHNDTPDFVRVVEVRLSPYQENAVQFRYQGWGY